MALAIVGGLANGSDAGPAYRAMVLPSGGLDTRALAAAESSYVGEGGEGFPHRAILWNGSIDDPINLHPPGFFETRAYAVAGDMQGGWGYGPATGGRFHALLWTGSAESVVDLNPTGYDNSYISAMTETIQVGQAHPIEGGGDHALLWRGTANDFTDLHPVDFRRSQVKGASGEMQVGVGETLTSEYRALMWMGTRESVVDLHPIGYGWSSASAVSGTSQVGSAVLDDNHHAVLWYGSADSIVDLHPTGYIESLATGVYGNVQVGSGYTENSFRALAWNGSAESVIDLHSYLDVLPDEYAASSANGMGPGGIIVGEAYRSDGLIVSVICTPVPEPSLACLLLAIGTTAIGARWRRPLFLRSGEI